LFLKKTWNIAAKPEAAIRLLPDQTEKMEKNQMLAKVLSSTLT